MFFRRKQIQQPTNKEAQVKIIAMTVLSVTIGISITLGQELTPKLTREGFGLHVSGYGQGIWSDHTLSSDKNKRNANWEKLVTHFDLGTPIHAIKFFSEVDFCSIDTENAWLEQAFMQISVTEKTTLRLGRVYLSGGHVTPLPDHLETARYPEVPYSIYGNGVQFETKLADSYKLTFDIATQTTSHENTSKMYDGIETSINIGKSFTNLNLTLSGQISHAKDFDIYGVDLSWEPVDHLHVKGALYKADGKVHSRKGGYLFLGYKFHSIELHTQVDSHIDAKNHSSTIWTKGVRIWSPYNFIEITVDHESIFSQKNKVDDRVYARLQIRF